jgi:hypothetical protein
MISSKRDVLSEAVITGIQAGITASDKIVPDIMSLTVLLRKQHEPFDEFIQNLEDEPEIFASIEQLVDRLRSYLITASDTEDEAVSEEVINLARKSIATFVKDNAVSIFRSTPAYRQLVSSLESHEDDPEGWAASVPVSAVDSMLRILDQGNHPFFDVLFTHVESKAKAQLDELGESWNTLVSEKFGSTCRQTFVLEPSKPDDLLVIGIEPRKDNSPESIRKEPRIGRFLMKKIEEIRCGLGIKGLHMSGFKPSTPAVRNLLNGGTVEVFSEDIIRLTPYWIDPMTG